MSGAPPPNWYPDPHDATQLRWWDGTNWTDHRHPLTTAATKADEHGASDTAPASAGERAASDTAPAVSTVAGAPADQWTIPSSEVGPRSSDAPPRAPETMTSWSTSTLPAQLPVRTIPRSQPGPDRRPMFIGLAVLAVIVIGALVFALTRGDDDPRDVVSAPTSTASPGSTTAPATTATSTITATTRSPASTAGPTTAAALAGTTFSDSANVYRLRVAPTWQEATVIGGLQTWATGTGSSVFRDSVNVLVEKLPLDISMDDYIAASVRNAPRSLPTFVEVNRSVSTVSGKVLGQLDFRSNQNIPLRHRAVVLIKGRNAIVVTYTAEPDRFDAEVAKLQPYLTSVEGV